MDDALFLYLFRETVRQRYDGQALLPRDAELVVGVSGGPDSMALLYLLYTQREEYAWKLSVAHVNHGLRGEASDADQTLVEAYCSDCDLPVSVRRATPPASGTGIEEWGRNVRRAFFAELAHDENTRVVLAHHARDQIETMVMHERRGCGPHGAAGMRPLSRLEHTFIARPLLYLPVDLRDFCRRHEIPFREDKSNLDPRYLRNAIRLGLATMSDKEHRTIVKKAEALIVRASKRRAERDEEVRKEAVARLDDRTIASLRGVASPRRTDVLYHVLRECGVMCDNRRMLEGLSHKLEDSEPQWSMDVGGGMRFVRRYDRWDIAPIPRGEASPAWTATANGWEGPAGWRIARRLDIATHCKTPDLWTAGFAGGEWMGACTVRCRRPGDRIHLLGCGTRKVKKLFIEARIPSEARETWPLVVFADEVLWVPGLGRSDRYLLPPEGGPALVLSAQRMGM